MALAGCIDFGIPGGPVGPGFGQGAIVADEPQSALIGRNILSQGGNAADAAVAMYFALAVTYPSSAGLGGGGVCVVRAAPTDDRKEPVAEVLDFTVAAPSAPPGPGLVPVGVPGNARGMFALQARYGRLQWSQVLLPSESLARFGVRVSRAFAKELALADGRLANTAANGGAFRNSDGAALVEGSHLVQVDLAGVIGRIRLRGPGDLYSGDLARTIVQGVREAGGHLSAEDLRAFRPKWMAATERRYGSYTVYFPDDTITGGEIAADLWRQLYEDGRYGKSDTAARDGVIIRATAEAMARSAVPVSAPAFADPPAPADPAVTGFAVMDGAGSAVACAVTLNGRFGSGRTIRGTGIVAAAAPGGPDDGRRALAPMVIASRHTATALAAAAPAGDASAPAAMISVALRLLGDDETISRALGAARAFPGLDNKTVYVEQRDGASARLAGMADHKRIAVPALGRVNLIYCPKGLPDAPESCVFGADPRGFGYAVDAKPVEN